MACVEAVAPTFAQVSIEVQVWDTETYRRLAGAGCDGVVVYQEAYDPDTYAAVHLKGKKRNYAWRLAAPDRAAEAGMRRLGIGALLGLHPDWRSEAHRPGCHAQALIRRWWRCEVSVALPRLRPAAGGYEPADPVDDRPSCSCCAPCGLVLPDVGITLSTREPAALAGRPGTPRGHQHVGRIAHRARGLCRPTATPNRSSRFRTRAAPAEVAAALRAAGYDPVWKDWQRA